MTELTIRIGREIKNKLTKKVALYLGIIGSLVTIGTTIYQYFL